MDRNEVQNLEDKIKAHILENADGPGSRIETEQELAKRFNVTRYRVRNVLNGLSQQGIITKTPRKGTFINQLDTDAITNNIRFNYQVSNFNLYESIEARIVVELSIIPLVVRRITPSGILELEGFIHKMLNNLDDPQVADEADMAFHAAMLRASGNQLLNSFSQIISQLFHQVEYRKRYWEPEIIKQLAMEHFSILEAIQEGNTDLTVQRLKQHLSYTKKIELDGLRKAINGNNS